MNGAFLLITLAYISSVLSQHTPLLYTAYYTSSDCTGQVVSLQTRFSGNNYACATTGAATCFDALYGGIEDPSIATDLTCTTNNITLNTNGTLTIVGTTGGVTGSPVLRTYNTCYSSAAFPGCKFQYFSTAPTCTVAQTTTTTTTASSSTTTATSTSTTTTSTGSSTTTDNNLTPTTGTTTGSASSLSVTLLTIVILALYVMF
eukprot:TRINITY_DN658_c0_g1_i3.p1 TRINITY_DN658_c0_g1~~TRINITY_DN658_c0_g1_i3.p1  ORF type:complete len:203 (-),score=49.46 TRINITY_DN658_c0_g1_i3:144-752(-)